MSASGNERKRYAPAVLLVLTALLSPLSLLLSALWPQLRTSAAAYYGCLSLQELLLWLLPALCMLPWRHQRLGPKAGVRPLALLAVPVGLAAQVFASRLSALLPRQAAGTALPQPATPGEWLLAALALVLLPALCEEAFFRGCLTCHLLDALHPAWACGLSVLYFTLIHGSVAELPGLLLISLLCTLLMLATGRLWAPVAAHMAFNAMALLLPLLPDTPWLLLTGLLPLGLAVLLPPRLSWRKRKEQPPTTRSEALLLGFLMLGMLARLLI